MQNFTRMLSSKFEYAIISKYGTSKFKDFSRTFKDLLCFQGLSRAWNFFQNSRTFKDFSRTL